MHHDKVATIPLWRRLLLPGILASVALGILITLGTWQVQRMYWKEELITNVSAKLRAEPVALPSFDEWSALDPIEIQYKRVTVSGRFLHAYEQRAYMVVSKPISGQLGGQGYWIMTPFELVSGGVVWTNRGFVPLHLVDEDTKTNQDEVQTLTALIRLPEKAGFATPGNEVGFDGTIWFVRDPAAMTLQSDLPARDVAPFFIDLEASSSQTLPQAGETRVEFSNRHFGYVLTWYGIALTLVGVFVAYAVREYRRQDSKTQ